MKILFVVPYVPSLIRTRSFNLIRHLSARGHQVIVATCWSNDRERADVEELRTHCDEVHATHVPVWRSLVNCVQALPTAEPLQAVYSWSTELRSRVRHLQTTVDVVHVEHLRGAKYGLPSAAGRARLAAPVVWDSVDCISYLFEQAVKARGDRLGRIINRVELSRTRRYEGWLPRQFDRVLITSDADKAALMALVEERAPARLARPAGEEIVSVLPNGVDTSYFTPAGAPCRSKTLVFSGKMSYHANVSAASHLITDIMPAIWARQPDVHLSIVGKDPAPTIRALAARRPQVSVTGTVPDIRPFLRSASAAVIPLTYGAGSQFKVLEAMACATPVVATPKAVSALNTERGKDVLVADRPDAFAEAVLGLLDSPRRQQEIGLAGRHYVEAHHRWDRLAARLENVYEEVLAGWQDARRTARLSA